MFRLEKQKNHGGEWLGEEEQNEGEKTKILCYFFFLITVVINKGYFLFLHFLMYFFYKFTIIFVKSNLNHENHIL